MKQHILIIRGLPGSGKSTLAKAMCANKTYAHIEADHFFCNPETGEYKFDPSKLQKAHEWCQKKCLTMLAMGKNVVVSNTFTCIWEMHPYIDMGFPYNILECKGNFKNVHNVPNCTIKKMRERWEPYIPQ